MKQVELIRERDSSANTGVFISEIGAVPIVSYQFHPTVQEEDLELIVELARTFREHGTVAVILTELDYQPSQLLTKLSATQNCREAVWFTVNEYGCDLLFAEEEIISVSSFLETITIVFKRDFILIEDRNSFENYEIVRSGQMGTDVSQLFDQLQTILNK